MKLPETLPATGIADPLGEVKPELEREPEGLPIGPLRGDPVDSNDVADAEGLTPKTAEADPAPDPDTTDPAKGVAPGYPGTDAAAALIPAIDG